MSFVTVKKVNTGKTLAPLKIGAGVFGLFLFGSAFFKTQTANGKILPVFFSLLSIYWLIKGIIGTRVFKDMYRIDAVLAHSEKRSVSVAEIAFAAGISEKKVLKRIKKFLKKGYFHGCELVTDGEPRVLIVVESEEAAETEEITLTCPDCGTEFTAKRGAVARCPECASIINM